MKIDQAVTNDVLRTMDRLEKKHGVIVYHAMSRLLTRRRNRNKLNREIATARKELEELEKRK
ncbi:hypothetical protein LCGC14_1281650 [marine sediment metagenome]|uniref:Uncharacterized protein n=1 Tax=marine sediment metagenome TaxID=412755 RepID=A0A0F9NY32_9ZZZZ